MRQAIVTKYHGPTNSRGSRVSATSQAGRIYVPWDHSKGIDENHGEAAKAMATKLEWYGVWHAGGLPGSGNVFVMDDALDGRRRELRDNKIVKILL